MIDEYRCILKKFYPFDGSLEFPEIIEEEELPELAKEILEDIRRQKRLTYVDAYAALEIVYKFLKQESNFVPIKNPYCEIQGLKDDRETIDQYLKDRKQMLKEITKK
jgi:hypothetical protein